MEENKYVILQDSTRGFSSELERLFANWINENPEEAASWFKSLSLTKPELPKKKKLLPKLKARPKMIFPNNLKVR